MGGDIGGATNDEGISFRKVARELVQRAAGTGIDLPALRTQQVQCGNRKVVSNNNFQWRSGVCNGGLSSLGVAQDALGDSRRVDPAREHEPDADIGVRLQQV